MKRIIPHLLATLASVALLGATAFGQAVSGAAAPVKPSPPGSAGAESTTQGTGATGGVTSGGTRATGHGSDLAPGSINSVGGAPSAVDPARTTVVAPGATIDPGTSRFTPAPPPARTRLNSGPSAQTPLTTDVVVSPGGAVGTTGVTTSGAVATPVAPAIRAATPAPAPATLPGTTGAGSIK
jgi:hypothetical protein